MLPTWRSEFRTSTADRRSKRLYSPLVRGHFGERDPWQTQGGGATEPLLRALGIRYDCLTDPATVERRIADAQTLAYNSLHPVAVLLTRELMWEEA